MRLRDITPVSEDSDANTPPARKCSASVGSWNASRPATKRSLKRAALEQ